MVLCKNEEVCEIDSYDYTIFLAKVDENINIKFKKRN